MRIIIVCVLALLVGCIPGMPGSITDRTSQIDGLRNVMLEPAYLYQDEGMMSQSLVRLGLFWTSGAPNKMIMTAMVGMLVPGIRGEESLRFNIDGEVITLSMMPTSRVEFRQGGTWLRYSVDRQLIERLVNGKRVIADFGGIECLFSQDRYQSARPAFREFLLATAPTTTF